jgi:hypothetical protein
MAWTLFGASCARDGVEDAPVFVPLDASELTVVGGPATCAACTSVRLQVIGRGVDEVVAASFVAHDLSHTTLPAISSVRTVFGNSPPVIEVASTLRTMAPAGSYDLVLHTDRAGTDRTLLLRNAMSALSSASNALHPRLEATHP